MTPVAMQKEGSEKNLSDKNGWKSLYAACTEPPTAKIIIPVT